MVYTLSGGFIWLNIFFAPVFVLTPALNALFLKHPIGDQIVAALPVPVSKVPHLMIVAMIALAAIPNFLVIFYISLFRKGGYDNNNPRENHPAFLDKHGFAARNKAAHFNTLENLPLFIGCIYIAQSLGLAELTVAKMTTFYIICRTLFNIVYAFNFDLLRTYLFVVSLGGAVMMACMAIFPSFDLVAWFDAQVAMSGLKLEL